MAKTCTCVALLLWMSWILDLTFHDFSSEDAVLGPLVPVPEPQVFRSRRHIPTQKVLEYPPRDFHTSITLLRFYLLCCHSFSAFVQLGPASSVHSTLYNTQVQYFVFVLETVGLTKVVLYF